MKRLTKAAIATGGAAVLLVGGAGTVAYWTDTATATGTSVTSGDLSVTDGSCGAWDYDDSDEGGTAGDIVPGDLLVTTCEVTVAGTGTHLGVTAELDASSTFDSAAPNPLSTALVLTTSDIAVNGVSVPVDPTQGVSITGTSNTITVTVTAEFPYGTDTSPGNDTQDLTALLDNVVINVVQTHTPPTP
ncbi:MAG: alternate-type signal peptide domain-containing protein [Micrococcales bacterium]|nr:alternate-type signal peptide domain-containing protein [Micrococcales bacterium]MCL2666503.1 alternate-type signal peptide domain-containing protein [Micrococcales bacterium]